MSLKACPANAPETSHHLLPLRARLYAISIRLQAVPQSAQRLYERRPKSEGTTTVPIFENGIPKHF